MTNGKQIVLMAVLCCLLTIIPTSAQTWESTNGPWRANVTDLAAGRAVGATTATLYNADATVLYRSTDGTATWTATSSLGGNPLTVACKQSTPSVVLAAITGAIKKSAGSGDSWDNVYVQSSYFDPIRLAVSPANTNLMFLGIKKYGGQPSMLRSPSSGDLNTWSYVGDFSGAIQTDVVAIAPHPTDANKIWAAGKTSGTMNQQKQGGFPEAPAVYTKGVFYSSDAGVTWNEFALTDKDVFALAGFTVSSTIYVFAGTVDGVGTKEIWKRSSTNGGASWSSWTVDKTVNERVEDLRFDGSGALYAVTSSTVYKKTSFPDGSWSIQEKGLYDKSNLRRIVVDPGNANNVFLGSGTTLYRSTDGGVQWTDAAQNITIMPVVAVAAKGTTMLAAPSNYSVVFRNTESGWNSVGLGPVQNDQDFRTKTIVFQSSGSNYVFAAGYKEVSGITYAKIYRSTNNGAAPWSNVGESSSPSSVFKGITVDPYNSVKIFAYGTYTAESNLGVSLNNGNNGSFEQAIIGTGDFVIEDLVADPTNPGQYSNILYAASSSSDPAKGGIWKSTNGGVNNNWSRTDSPLTSPVYALGLNPKAPSVLYAAGGTSGSWWIKKTTDGGTTWTTASSLSFQVTRIVMHPSYPNSYQYFWILSADSKVYKTTDGGQHLTNVTNNLPTPIYDLRKDPSSNVLFYVATASGVYKINPAPEAPTRFEGENYNGKPKFSWDPAPEADFKQYELHRYFLEDCFCWPKFYCETPTEDVVIATITDRNTTSYVDASQTIVTFPCKANSSRPRQAIYYLVIKDQAELASPPSSTKVFNVAAGMGTEKTAVKNEDFREKRGEPLQFSLESNYPNPFNPSTKIDYVLPEDAHVILKVYDIFGREVATVVNEFQEAGYKEVSFDASNLPSGVYFYRMAVVGQNGIFSYQNVKKMLLMK
jgi:hypothetical protein